jgi:Domain of unknown function (DUF4288)
MYIAFKDGRQDTWPVWENVILVNADTEDGARAKAAGYARETEGDSDGTLRWAQRPASWVFAGVRKLVKCDSDPERPDDGTEITYTETFLRSLDAVRDLAAGRRVSLPEYD